MQYGQRVTIIERVLAIFKYFIPLAAAITLICGLVYAAVQQDIRRGANDPQIQIAEDTASRLSGGQNPADVIFGNQVDISKSLAPFMMIFDDSGRIVASSANLEGRLPQVPAGVFDYVRRYGEDRFTWQPREDARSAVIVTRYKGAESGFVLVGRSITEIENREAWLEIMVGIAWVVTLLSTFVLTAVLTFLVPGRNK